MKSCNQKPMIEPAVDRVQQRWLYPFVALWNSSIFVRDPPHMPRDKCTIEHLSRNR